MGLPRRHRPGAHLAQLMTGRRLACLALSTLTAASLFHSTLAVPVFQASSGPVFVQLGNVSYSVPSLINSTGQVLSAATAFAASLSFPVGTRNVVTGNPPAVDGAITVTFSTSSGIGFYRGCVMLLDSTQLQALRALPAQNSTTCAAVSASVSAINATYNQPLFDAFEIYTPFSAARQYTTSFFPVGSSFFAPTDGQLFAVVHNVAGPNLTLAAMQLRFLLTQNAPPLPPAPPPRPPPPSSASLVQPSATLLLGLMSLFATLMLSHLGL